MRTPGRLVPLAALLLLSGCDSLFGPDDAPESIEISASTQTLSMVGDTVHLSAVVKDEGGRAVEGAAVEWESRESDVVSIGSDAILTAAGNGSTWVVASSGEANDSIEVTVNSPIPCAPAGELMVADTLTGSLASSDCPQEGYYADIWQFELESAMEISFELVSQAFDAFLILLNGSGVTIDFDDDGGVGGDSRLFTQLEAGSYFVVASTYAPGEVGPYQLSAIEGAIPSPCPATASLDFPGTVSGEVTAESCDFSQVYLDVWRLELPADTVVTFQLESEDFAPLVVVADTLGNFHNFSDFGPANTAWLEMPLAQGDYDIWVGGIDAPHRTGSYTLEVAAGPTSLSCPATGTVSPTTTVEGVVTADDCFLLFGYGDAWDLEVSDEPMELDLTVHSGTFAPAMLVVDPDGEIITAFGGAGPLVHFSLRLVPGQYRVWVMGVEEDTGSYTLAVGEDGMLPACDPEGEVLMADTVTAALASTDCSYPGGRFGDVWTTRVESTTTVTVSVGSDKFDPYLMVADSSGRRIAFDDDSGGDLNAQLTLELEPGLYQMIATSYAPEAVGEYELALIEGAPAAPASESIAPWKQPRELPTLTEERPWPQALRAAAPEKQGGLDTPFR